MSISSKTTSVASRLEAVQTPRRPEASSRAFSLSSSKAATAVQARPETRAHSVDSPLSTSLRSIAADVKSGKIQSKEEGIQKAVAAMLQEKFGKTSGKDSGFQKMQQSISNIVIEDPNLSKRVEQLLNRLS